MPSIRAPVLRTALQPSARVLPRATQPFVSQIRLDSTRNTRDEKWYEPNDGGKSRTPPENKGPTAGYKLDGTGGALNSNRSLMYVSVVTSCSRRTVPLGMLHGFER